MQTSYHPTERRGKTVACVVGPGPVSTLLLAAGSANAVQVPVSPSYDRPNGIEGTAAHQVSEHARTFAYCLRGAEQTAPIVSEKENH